MTRGSFVVVAVCGGLLTACGGATRARGGSLEPKAAAPSHQATCFAICEKVGDGCYQAAEAQGPGTETYEATKSACADIVSECNQNPAEYCDSVRTGCAKGIQESVTQGTIEAGSPEESAGRKACEQAYHDCMVDPCN